VADGYSASVLLLAVVLFLWTPSHFWSLAIAMPEDYRRAGVPMLPVVYGPGVAARWTLANTVALAASTVALAALVGDPLLWTGAVLGGGYLLLTNLRMYRDPRPAQAMGAFRASLIQLGLLLAPLFTAFGIA
jgi:heme o synthase